MKCPACGKENASDAKFCNSCGSPLKFPGDDTLSFSNHEDERIMEEVQETEVYPQGHYEEISPSGPSPQKKKSYKIISILVVLAILCVLGLFGAKAWKKVSLEKEATKAMEEGNYLDATGKFQDLYKATNEEKYQKKMTEAHALAQDSENLENAKNLLAQGSYKQALQKLLEIRNHDNALKQEAENVLTNLQTTVEGKVDAYNMMQDYSTSIQLLNGLLAVAPENESFLAMKTHALSAQTGMNEEKARAETEAKAAEEKARKEEEAAASRAKQAKASSNIINTFQFVTSGSANVRSGPGKNYRVSYSLDRGSEVYVYDTYYDGTRTWCNIGDGWISYRTLNGEL